MNQQEMVQRLWQQIKQPKHSMEQLKQIFAEYQALVVAFSITSTEYKAALRHTPEEFPDLERLVKKGHDAVLKGRLVDAINALKKKVEMISGVVDAPDPEVPQMAATITPNLAEPPNEQAAPAADGDPDKKPKFRITPSLGMD
ncbi:MAG: hypothetical protein JST21_15475 [Bacteroidetes bacterium]|nr:hypothetical protein [Bacteroidota bacterium]MBS1747566.1 hypothetical protein [Bacteroidota bacterium]